MTEVTHHCPKAPVILVGTHIEKRATHSSCIMYEEAVARAREINAARYLEVSAKLFQGVNELFEEATRVAIVPSIASKTHTKSAFHFPLSSKPPATLMELIQASKFSQAIQWIEEKGVNEGDLNKIASVVANSSDPLAAELIYHLYVKYSHNPFFTLPLAPGAIPLQEEQWTLLHSHSLALQLLYSHFSLIIAKTVKAAVPTEKVSLKNLSLQVFFLPKGIPMDIFLNIRELDLSNNLLQSLPASFFPEAKKLTRLDLSKNKLRQIPAGISNLSLLEVLDLSGNLIQEVHDGASTSEPQGEIFKLPALIELNLENNLLSSIPPLLVQLALRPRFSLKLLGNTSLRIPQSTLQNADDLVQYFINELKGETIPWQTVKLVTVGQEKVGKTTLLGKLQNITTDGLSTDGISIGELITGSTRFSTWDFGGQEIYYPTHQFFLTGCALYLVLFNIKEEQSARVEYWLKQIRSLASHSFTRIILVATHADKWTEGKNLCDVHLKSLLNKYRHYGVRDIVAVSCTTGAGLPTLQALLIDLSSHPEFHRHVNTTWCRLAQVIEKSRDSCPHMRWNEFVELAKSCGFEGNLQRECESAAAFLHEMGILLHFKDPLSDLGNMVILNPQWLADVMATIITTKGNFVANNGTLDHSNLVHIWKGKYPLEMHESLLRLLSFFGVMFPMRVTPPKSLVPCLLDDDIPIESVMREWPKTIPKGLSEYSRMYTFPQLPLGFFGRVVARLLYLDINPLVLWRSGMVANVNSVNRAFFLYTFAESSSVHAVHSLSITLRSPSRQSTAVAIEMITESIDATINCFYENVTSEMSHVIMCPGCIKAVDGVALVNYEDIAIVKKPTSRKFTISSILKESSEAKAKNKLLQQVEPRIPETKTVDASPQTPQKTANQTTTEIVPSPNMLLPASETDLYSDSTANAIASEAPVLTQNPETHNVTQSAAEYSSSDTTTNQDYSSDQLLHEHGSSLPLHTHSGKPSRHTQTSENENNLGEDDSPHSKHTPSKHDRHKDSASKHKRHRHHLQSPHHRHSATTEHGISLPQEATVSTPTTEPESVESNAEVVASPLAATTPMGIAPSPPPPEIVSSSSSVGVGNIATTQVENPLKEYSSKKAEIPASVASQSSPKLKPKKKSPSKTGSEELGQPHTFVLADVIRSFLGGFDAMECPGVKSKWTSGDTDRTTDYSVRHIPHPGSSVLIQDLAPEVTMGGFTIINSGAVAYNPATDKLGEGTFAKVFRGLWKNKIVAVKELKVSPEVLESPDITKIFLDFKSEASLMQTLHHPNIVEFFGVMLDPLRIVMGLVPAGSLDKLLRKAKVNPELLPVKLQQRIILDITKGLAYLHTQEPPIIHRDLRSPNILLESVDPKCTSVAKIADFGLSERLIPQASGLLLTWQWIAPEALDATNCVYDEKSDVYSLGMVILETYARSPPFEELWESSRFCRRLPGGPEGHPGVLNVMSIKAAICKEGLRPVVPHECPIEIQHILSSTWDHNPQNRPSTVLIQKKLNSLFGATPDVTATAIPKSVSLARCSRVLVDLPLSHRAWAVVYTGDNIWFGTEKEFSAAPPTPQNPASPALRKLSSASSSAPESSVNTLDALQSTGYACIFSPDTQRSICTLEVHNSRPYSLLHMGSDILCSSEEGQIHIVRKETYLVKKKVVPHASGRMIKCLTPVTTPNGDFQIWSCSPSSENGEIAVLSSTYSLIGMIALDQPVNIASQVSQTYVWAGCYGLVIAIDIDTLKITESIPLTSRGKVTGLVCCASTLESVVWTACSQTVFGLGLNSKQTIFKMDFEANVTCLYSFADLVLCGDTNSQIRIYSCHKHNLVHTLEGFPKKPVKAMTAAKGNMIWVAFNSTDKALVFIFQ
ncbi:leucinerich repeat kinase [Pelomyxa schiedti]|nr:leucinerich repeat kinase [Pelomyxa schiedti]